MANKALSQAHCALCLRFWSAPDWAVCVCVCLLEWSAERGLEFRAQPLAAAGADLQSGRQKEQGADCEAGGPGVNNQVKVQIQHLQPGGQERSAGRTGGFRNEVSGGATNTGETAVAKEWSSSLVCSSV